MNQPSFDFINPLSANPTKWSNTLKQFVGKLRTKCLSAFDHFVKLALKGLRPIFLIFRSVKYTWTRGHVGHVGT